MIFQYVLNIDMKVSEEGASYAGTCSSLSDIGLYLCISNMHLLESRMNYLIHSILYVLLTVHLVTVFVENQLDAQFFFMFVYFYSPHVSDSYVSIIRRINCINTTSGICHSV